MTTFAHEYLLLKARMLLDPELIVNFECRGLKMAREITGAAVVMDMSPKGISFFSHKDHRVTPIRFTLAELCYILSGSNELASIAYYNKSMAHYSDDGKTISGAYGIRLVEQLPVLAARLKEDIYTRQACATIFQVIDCTDTKAKHKPCNIFLQFLCRPPFLDLHVTSRSSDFVTGFSIDTIHWQALLVMMANELRAAGFIDVMANRVYYNIASLHVYAADWPVVKQWKPIMDKSYEHFLPLSITLTDAIEKAKRLFTGGLMTTELMDILSMDVRVLPTVVQLEELFRNHKNVLVR